MKLNLKTISARLGGELAGNGEIVVQGVSGLEEGRSGTVVWAENRRALKQAEAGKAAAVICGLEIEFSSKPLIRTEKPKLAFTRLTYIFLPPGKPEAGISPRAEVSPEAVIGKDVTVEAFAVIEKGAAIEDGAVIGAGSFVGVNSRVGAATRLYPNVTVNERVTIGRNCVIHSGAVLGGDGFGFVEDENGRQLKIPQLGGVVLEDEVEIGCNTTVDRATWGNTVIRRGVKIDNLVQIAHNDDIGENTVIAGLSGLSGSVKVGRNVIMGGNVGIADHVEIGDRAILGGRTGIAARKKIKPGEILLGSPARPFKETKKLWAWQGRLVKKLMKEEEDGPVSD